APSPVDRNYYTNDIVYRCKCVGYDLFVHTTRLDGRHSVVLRFGSMVGSIHLRKTSLTLWIFSLRITLKYPQEGGGRGRRHMPITKVSSKSLSLS
ncbi:hypothetical protein, partial [uncultured Alistipes sp.]